MTTQANIAAGLDRIVNEHTSDDDGPCGPYEDGNAIANASFNYALGLAIDAAVATSVDLEGVGTPAHLTLIKMIDELKAMRIPL